jgi:hypothetical protein
MSFEDKKTYEKMKFIYKAIENGWSVKKSNTHEKTFEFSKKKSDNDKSILCINPIFFNKTIINEDINNRKITKYSSEPIIKN